MENNTVFVLLAGGKSERMGVAKGLLKYKHTFWILEQLNRISKSKINTVYIGLGFNYQHYFDAISWLKNAVDNYVNFEDLKVCVVINKKPEKGPFSTLQTVLNKVEFDKNILVNHIDIPVLNSTELNKIILEESTVVKPSYKGKNGHPIKLSAEFCNYLKTINPTDENARLDVQLKKINPVKISIIEVNDKVILNNINTKKEWISFLDEQ